MRILLPMLLSLLLVGSGVATAADPPAAVPESSQVPAPEALGIGVDQQPLRLSQFRGKVVVLSFWASWCAPCVAEMSVLENLQQIVGYEQLAVLGINWRESRRDFRRLQEQLQHVHLTLGSDADGAVGVRYGVTAIPQLFVIDQQGRIAYRHSGYDPQAVITPLLAEITLLLQTAAAHGDEVHAKMADEPEPKQR